MSILMIINIEQNKFMYAFVIKTATKEIGEWTHDNPLNKNSKREQEFYRIFKE